ncbi:ATP-binding cassette domain-containing protein [Oceanispirochaeta crateris]|uniref:ATP-binding cassette domain-containing protein n=1 Tax=Oceanispirochaeta crateris TaxID=2518645 RepID=UPI00143D0B9C|nr:ATP-binding cassette domain-containing protein [Oceanispirochaeta crateris]
MISLSNISHTYGSVKALDRVTWEMQPGEIHALIGEHGAGKSSLAHILSGFIQLKGEIFWKGELISPLNDQKARSLGIAFVTQGTELFNHLSVAYNLFNNHKDVFPGFFISQRKILAAAESYLRETGCTISPTKIVGDLSLPEKVMINILRQLHTKPELLILDEAIEKLTAIDLDLVLKLIRKMRDRGGTILFITHRIDDVYEFADRVTILRNGSVLITESVKNIDKINLIKLAYTQIVRNKSLTKLDKDFYHLLKYNEAILEFLPLALLVVNGEGHVKLLNHYGETFFHKKREVLLEAPFSEVFAEEDRGFSDEIYKILETKKWENLYQKHITIAGNKICCNVVIYPILDGNYYLGSIIIVDDISEQEKMREKIHFSEKLASIGLLAAGVAHEINNPLEIINNYLDVLKNRISNEESKTFLGYMEDELDSIEQIVSNLITFSEKNRYQDEKLNLQALVEQMLLLIKPNALQRGISIAVEIKTENPVILANRVKIKQVFLNILKNAFDAMPDGGEIHLVMDNKDNKFVRIRLLDSGIGLGERDIKDILLPFYTTKQEKEENMGLGLSIVFGILESYGGSIEIKNRRQVSGCEVTMILPLLKEKTDQPAG